MNPEHDEQIDLDDLQVSIDALSFLDKSLDAIGVLPGMQGMMPGIAKEQAVITRAKFERLMVQARRAAAAERAKKTQPAPPAAPAEPPKPQDPPADVQPSKILTKGATTKRKGAVLKKAV